MSSRALFRYFQAQTTEHSLKFHYFSPDFAIELIDMPGQLKQDKTSTERQNEVCPVGMRTNLQNFC